ncbi:MAG: hypothetical protein ACJ738_02340 [Gaiellales bacterium]|jgi:hypothetical protein
MLVAGLKRLGQLVGLVLAVALVLAVLGALLLHVPFRRSLSVTCYGLGGFFLLSGFFHGVRPAIRVEDDSGVMSMFGLLLTSGKLRTATLDERYEAISSSALFVGVALVLILVGGLVDPVHHLF